MNKRILTIMSFVMILAASVCSASAPEIWQQPGFDLSRISSLAFRQVEVDEAITGGNGHVNSAISFAIDQETGNLKDLVSHDSSSSPYVFDVKVEKYSIESTWVAPSASTTTRSESKSWTRKRRDGSEEKITSTLYWEEPVTHSGHFRFTGIVTMLITVYDNRTGQAVYRYYRTDDNDRRINSVRYITKEFCKKLRNSVKGE